MAKNKPKAEIIEDEMPQTTVQEPNVVFTRNYHNVKAGTKKYLQTIPKQLKDYVTFISK